MAIGMFDRHLTVTAGKLLFGRLKIGLARGCQNSYEFCCHS